MYPPMEMDNGTYYPKPMNCPMHCLIFDSRQRSYRELPLRLFELGTVYRYERAGTLHGLMRIRGFTQDDSHIYCTEEQLGDEIASLLDFVMSVLRAFGFTEFTANLSTKDPEKYVGGDEIWEKATEALRLALERHGLPYEVKEGDAAFYGPKIDIDVRDAIGRTLAAQHHPVRLQPPRAVRPRVRRGRQRPPPADHAPPGPVRLDRAVLRHPASSTSPGRCRPGWPPSRCASSASVTTTRTTPTRSPTGCAALGVRVEVDPADRAARRPDPQGEAPEDPLHPGGGGRRRGRRHGRA